MWALNGVSRLIFGSSPFADIEVAYNNEVPSLIPKRGLDTKLELKIFEADLKLFEPGSYNSTLPETKPLDEVTIDLLSVLLKQLRANHSIRETYDIRDIAFEVVNNELIHDSDGKNIPAMLYRHPTANLVVLIHSITWNPSIEGAVYLGLKEKGFLSETPYLKLSKKGAKQIYGIRLDR